MSFEAEQSIPQTVADSQQVAAELDIIERTRGWAGRHKVALSIGAVVASAGMTFAMNPAEEVVDTAKENAGWIAGGVIGGEVAWNIGAAMMLTSVGKKVPKNPLKWKEAMPEIAQKANESKLFKTGFVVNTTGAVSQFMIPAAVVATKMPPESWGIMTPLAADFVVTMTVRKSILNSIKNHAKSGEETHPSGVEL